MARPKKRKTKAARIDILVWKKAERRAKRKGMSVPDYLTWRLSR